MDVQIIKIILQQQKLGSIFLVDGQCQKFAHLITQKTNILYIAEKYCMKNLRSSLSEHAKNIIDFERKKMLPLTKQELKSHRDAKLRYICGKRILKKLPKSINY